VEEVPAILSIAYVSAAVTPMNDGELAELLVAARANNLRLGLTGALLYRKGRFIQILEGPDEATRDRFAIIEADPRHRSVFKMNEERILARQFPGWTMGFRPLSDQTVTSLPGFEDYFDSRTGKARLERADNQAQQFLEWLGEYWFSPH
jgi:hypothetical protein